MPETKKPMHPLNLPPTGTPGNGDSIKPKVFGKGGMGFGEGRESFSPEKFSLPSPIFLTCYNNSPSQLKRPGRVAAGIDLGGFSSMRAKKEYPAASSSGRCTVMSKGHAG